MPVLDFSQDGLDVIGHRSLAFAGVENRNRIGRDRVRKICLRYRFIHQFEIQARQSGQGGRNPISINELGTCCNA
jgi:hypothetical protein